MNTTRWGRHNLAKCYDGPRARGPAGRLTMHQMGKLKELAVSIKSALRRILTQHVSVE